MGRYRVFVWERGPKPQKRVVIETVSFINITIFSEVWRALEEPHLDWTVDVAAVNETLIALNTNTIKIQIKFN